MTHLDHVFIDAAKGEGRAMAVQNMARWLDECSVPSNRLVLGTKLGDGRFGPLHVATLLPPAGDARGDAQPVVAKACGTAALALQEHIRRDDIDQLTMFSAEAYLIGALKHPNILQVVGVIVDTIPMQMMTKHMRNGDLKSYLRACEWPSLSAVLSKCVRVSA
jgi:hypothetical protein